MPYKLKNDLTGLYFHDSSLMKAQRHGDTIFLTFESAAVIGHSCPELPHWTPCKLNLGEDRHAAPNLYLCLEGVKELKILEGGSWRDGGWAVPPRYLQEKEFSKVFQAIPEGGFGNNVQDLTWEGGTLTLGVWLDALHNYYELTCIPRSVTATWDSYGDVAWYVEAYRKKHPITPTFGAIDQDSLKWYTMLPDLLPAMESVFLSHNWLVTDVSCNMDNPIWDTMEQDGYCWLTGQALLDFAKTDNSQFINAVFSGFPPETKREQVLAHPMPSWDNPGYWYRPLHLQHPLANVELTPWDSSCLLFLSHDKSLVDQFRAAFPKSHDLAEHIQSYESRKSQSL